RQLWIVKALPPRIESWCGQRRLPAFYRWCAMKRLNLRGGSLVSRTDGTPDHKERDQGEGCKGSGLSRGLDRIGVGWGLKFRHARRLSHHPKRCQSTSKRSKKWELTYSTSTRVLRIEMTAGTLRRQVKRAGPASNARPTSD